MPRRKRKPPPPKPLGYVYFIGAMTLRRVKIGFSQFFPDGRFKTINTGSPEDLTKLGLIRGAMSLERELHARFAVHRAKLEWFHLAPEIVEFIAREALDWDRTIREEEEARRVKGEKDLAEMLAEGNRICQEAARDLSTAHMLGLA